MPRNQHGVEPNGQYGIGHQHLCSQAIPIQPHQAVGKKRANTTHQQYRCEHLNHKDGTLEVIAKNQRRKSCQQDTGDRCRDQIHQAGQRKAASLMKLVWLLVSFAEYGEVSGRDKGGGGNTNQKHESVGGPVEASILGESRRVQKDLVAVVLGD